MSDASRPTSPVAFEGQLCLPMTAGGQTVGVLGVPESARPFTEGQQRVFAAAATMLAIAVRNAQLFQELRENNMRDGISAATPCWPQSVRACAKSSAAVT